jgi:hypothetical protein
MLPYWLLFSVFAVGSLQNRARSHASARAGPLFGAACIFVVFMIGLRYQVGGDWDQYEEILFMFSYESLPSVLSSGDPGYALLNWAAAAAGAEVWFVNLICAALFSWGLANFARRQPNPWLAVLVGVPYLIIVVAMGYSRQGVAIGLVLAGLAILDKSVLRFIVYVLLAATFHKSAVVVLPLVAFALTKNRLILFPVILASIYLVYTMFVQAYSDLLYTNYVESKYQSDGAFIRVAMNVPPALIFLLARGRFNVSEQEGKLWRNFALAVVGCVAALMLTEATTAVDRVALYLIPIQMFVLSRIPDAFPIGRIRNYQLVLGVVTYSAMVQLVFFAFAKHAEYWVPYKVYPLI